MMRTLGLGGDEKGFRLSQANADAFSRRESDRESCFITPEDGIMTRPKEGQKMKCPGPNCTDDAVFHEKTPKPGTGSDFGHDDGHDFSSAAQWEAAWSCSSCGYYKPISD